MGRGSVMVCVDHIMGRGSVMVCVARGGGIWNVLNACCMLEYSTAIRSVMVVNMCTGEPLYSGFCRDPTGCPV